MTDLTTEAAELASGENRRIVIAARSSGVGPEGIRLVFDDLSGAADVLAAYDAALDVRKFLPSRNEISKRLNQVPTVTYESNSGSPFTAQIAKIPIPQANLILVVGLVSGAKLTKDLQSPFVNAVAAAMDQINPSVLAVKRLDRLGRSDWALGPVFLRLSALDALLCDEDGLREVDETTGLLSFIKGAASRREAKTIAVKVRNGQRKGTGKAMEDGEVPYRVSSLPPPGFGVCVKSAAAVAHRTRVAYLDCDEFRPNSAEGLGEVLDNDGNFIDQVEIVRWVLSVAGKPMWPISEIARELVARKYSTPGIRAWARETDAVVSEASARYQTQRILKYLDLYEKGTWKVALGAGVEPVEISDCWPPCGEWAKSEDFIRIRAHQARAKKHFGNRRKLALSGLPATYGGTEVVVRTASTRDTKTYRTNNALKFLVKGTETVPPNHGLVPVESFVNSIESAILEMGDRPIESVGLLRTRPQQRRPEGSCLHTASSLNRG